MPNSNPSPSQAVNAAAATHRHSFSPAQMEMIEAYTTQLAQAEHQVADLRNSIGLFMNYLKKEYGMSEDVTWNLAVNPEDGKYFMQGTPRPPAKPSSK